LKKVGIFDRVGTSVVVLEIRKKATATETALLKSTARRIETKFDASDNPRPNFSHALDAQRLALRKVPGY
jgi:hypothetical protein